MFLVCHADSVLTNLRCLFLEDAGCGGPGLGVVTRGRLDGLPNYLKHLWRQLMVEKLTFNSVLVDTPAVSMPTAHPQNL